MILCLDSLTVNELAFATENEKINKDLSLTAAAILQCYAIHVHTYTRRRESNAQIEFSQLTPPH